MFEGRLKAREAQGEVRWGEGARTTKPDRSPVMVKLATPLLSVHRRQKGEEPACVVPPWPGVFPADAVVAAAGEERWWYSR